MGKRAKAAVTLAAGTRLGLRSQTPRDDDRPRRPPLDHVTCRDYLVTMKGVGIADLKSRLSEHLRRVRRGRTVVVLDRDRPIAEIVPYRGDGPKLAIRPPRAGSRPLRDLALPPPLRLSRDVVEVLLAERQSGR